MADVFLMMKNLPEGYHFSPRDYEFINYLRRRKNGDPQPFNHRFLEIDLYNLKHPSQLFEGTSEKELFFFTTLKKQKPSSRRVIRIAGDGTWKSQHSSPVDDPNDCSPRNRRSIGDHTSLKFEGSSSGGGFRYIMHEYSLLKSENYLGVACVIKKEPPQKSSSFHGEEHQEVITEHGKKRPHDQEFGGEEECSGPHHKNMRLQCDSDYDASSQYRNSQSDISSLVCGSSSSELPNDAPQECYETSYDAEFDNLEEQLESAMESDECCETSNDPALDNLVEQLESELEYDECCEIHNDAEFDNLVEQLESELEYNECCETNNVDAASTQGETSYAPAVGHNALSGYDDEVYLWEPNPVATDQPYPEANSQQPGYEDAFGQWRENPFMAPDEGYMNQVSAAPEWQENLMQTTYTPDPVDYYEDLSAFF